MRVHCRVIYGLVSSQVGDFQNSLVLSSGEVTTPAAFVRSQYGYKHTFLGESPLTLKPCLPPKQPVLRCHCLMSQETQAY